MKNINIFFYEILNFTAVKKSLYTTWACFRIMQIYREEGQNHLVTLNSNGDVESGSKSAVITAIRKGHHMRVSRTDYSYPCDALEHSADESLAVCTSLWSVSQRTVQRDGYNVKTFTVRFYLCYCREICREL